MSEISKVIASEIADFFAGFGGPGEPDIQSGEAQRLLTERLLSVLALRERAEPVADDDRARQEYENHVRSRYQYPMLERHTEDGSPWNGEYKEPARQMEWEDWQCSWNACRAAMLATPSGKKE